MFNRELKKNYENALESNSDLRRRIIELEELICPFNKHDYTIIDEFTNSNYSRGELDYYTKRTLQCKRCKKIIHDDNYVTGFKYKVSEE